MSNSDLILGVDPGVHGAVAAVWKSRRVEVWDLPTLKVKRNGKNRTEYDRAAVLELFKEHTHAVHCYIEDVHAGAIGAKAGSVASFNFGYSVGFLHCIFYALNIPFTLVRPLDWKRAVGLPKGATKDQSRQLAAQLYPGARSSLLRKKDEHRAEAILIARYGVMTYGNGN